MGDRRCCCVTECIVYSDNFDRENGPLGADWIASETAAIDTLKAKITSGNIIYQKEVVDPLGSFIVTFSVVDPVDNDVYEFIAVDNDDNELLAARFEVDATAGVWNISIRGSVGAWYADNVELIAGCGVYQETFLTSRSFTISYDRKAFRIGGTTPEHPHYELWQCYDVGAAIQRVGFRHGGGPQPIYIDNFVLSDHYVHNTDCPYHGCLCGAQNAYCPPDTFTGILTNPSGCYVQWGATETITFNKVYRSQTLWTTGRILPCYGCTTDWTFYRQFFLWCAFTPGGPTWRLGWGSDYPGTTPMCNMDSYPEYFQGEWTETGEECSPLYLQFTWTSQVDVCNCEPTDCECSPPICAPITLEITE